MSYPAEADELSLDDPRVRLGETLFASWILLLGLVPVERMRVTLVEIDPGRSFVEQSGVSMLRFWRHERRIEPTAGGCVLTETLTVAAPLSLMTPVVGWLVRLFFAHRYRRLRTLFA
ncbi:MAG: hypothetical protein JWN44_5640 [Myxococcales bacterium]|nr:hypothetical protein [Myxococcales bacterium]